MPSCGGTVLRASPSVKGTSRSRPLRVGVNSTEIALPADLLNSLVVQREFRLPHAGNRRKDLFNGQSSGFRQTGHDLCDVSLKLGIRAIIEAIVVPLNGVIDIPWGNLSELKRQALFFDKLHIVRREGERAFETDEQGMQWAEYEFLRESGLIADVSVETFRVSVHEPNIGPIFGAIAPTNYLVNTDAWRGVAADFTAADSPPSTAEGQATYLRWVDSPGEFADLPDEELGYFPDTKAEEINHAITFWSDYHTRQLATHLSSESKSDFIPICRLGFSEFRKEAKLRSPSEPEPFISADVLELAFVSFPIPDEDCPWEPIMEFRAEARDPNSALHGKAWDFRRFLHTLSTKKLSATELEDEFNYNFYQYDRAMKIQGIKTKNMSFKAYMSAGPEIILGLGSLDFGRIMKGFMSCTKSSIELREAELKAPGHETAYLYESLRRF